MQLPLDFGDSDTQPKKKPVRHTTPKTHTRDHHEDALNPEALLTRRLTSRKHLHRLEKVTLGVTIRKLRIRNRLKQADLARKLKTTQSAIARIENGRQNISIELLMRIAEVFGKKIHISMR